jgi:hypothetical protein
LTGVIIFLWHFIITSKTYVITFLLLSFHSVPAEKAIFGLGTAADKNGGTLWFGFMLCQMNALTFRVAVMPRFILHAISFFRGL